MEQVEFFTRQGVKTRPTGQTDKGRPTYSYCNPCMRCGGMGGSDKWAATGWTCYKCGGSGKSAPKIGRLYTADELAKLTARKERADAIRATKRAEAAAAEAARVAAERDAVARECAPLVARIAAAGFTAESEGFFGDMVRNMTQRAKRLTPAQLDATTAALERIEAEAARRANARHVGVVGERIELELTAVKSVFLYTRDAWPQTSVYLNIARDADGNTIIHKGAFNAFGFDLHKGTDSVVEGSTVKVRATVKEHTNNRKHGAAETIVQRPMAIKQ